DEVGAERRPPLTCALLRQAHLPAPGEELVDEGHQRREPLAEGQGGVAAGVDQVAPLGVAELPRGLHGEGAGHLERVEDREQVGVAVAGLEAQGIYRARALGEQVGRAHGQRRTGLCPPRSPGAHLSGTAVLLPAPSSATTWAPSTLSTRTEKENSGPGVNASATSPMRTEDTPMLSRATPSTRKRLPDTGSTLVSSTVGGVASRMSL